LNTSLYLDRYAWPQALFPQFTPPKDLGMVVVLPAFKETNISMALESLNQCLAPEKEVLLLVVINEPKNAPRDVQKINAACLETVRSFDSRFHMLTTHLKLPEKKAGAVSYTHLTLPTNREV